MDCMAAQKVSSLLCGVQLSQAGGVLGRAGIQRAGADAAAAPAGMRARPAAHAAGRLRGHGRP